MVKLQMEDLFSKKMKELKSKITDLLVSVIYFLKFLRDLYMKIWPLVNSSRISAFRWTFSTNRISIRLIGKFEEIFRLQQVCWFGFLITCQLHVSIHVHFQVRRKQRRKQSAKINNTHSIFEVLSSDVPQISMLGLILCNIFRKDSFYWVK